MTQNMSIEFDLDQLTEQGRKLLLVRSNEWNCPPAEAMRRILDEEATRQKVAVPRAQGTKNREQKIGAR
jgi:hypothetical protein